MKNEYKIIDFELGKFQIKENTDKTKLLKVVNNRIKKANKRKLPK